MLRNYITIAWRKLLKQPMYSSIKIGGFALGIAACLLISLFIRDELSYDRHYPDADQIYRVVAEYKEDGDLLKSVYFPAPFAGVLKEEYPEVEKVGRINAGELFGAGSNQIRPADRKESAYEEGFAYADQEVLDILGTPMVYGDARHALDAPNSIVISQRKAEKYFPGQNPVGKVMYLNNDLKQPLTIGGVMENFPANSHLKYDFLITMKGRELWEGEQTYWRAQNYFTYVRLKPGTDAGRLSNLLDEITKKYLVPAERQAGNVDAGNMVSKLHFDLQPVKDIYLKSNDIFEDGLSRGDIRLVWLFGGIAAFIMILACINFVNLSTARSANRAVEAGLRYSVGCVRESLVTQFLAESVLFCLLSFAVGMLLAWLFLPLFNDLASKSLTIPLNEWWLLPLMTAGAAVTGILAGLYPAFYLSSFKPINVLKGRLALGSKKSSMRSALVVFQFTTSIVLIIGTFIIYRQMGYILNKKVGFDKDRIILLHGANTMGDKVHSFKKELVQLSGIKHASIGDYLPVKGTKRNGNTFFIEGKSQEEKGVGGQMWRIDHDYLRTLGIKLVAGRNFSPEMPTDSAAVIINQAMAKELGLDNPVGKRIQNWQPYTIIGVVEDFHYSSMKEEIRPLCMVLGHSPSIISLKANTADPPGLLASVTDLWKTFSPDQPIRYSFLDEKFAVMYKDVLRMGRVFSTFAVLAIVVACLGLFALSAFMVEQRGKEISIRLVLGASVKSILALLSLNFLKLVLISFVIAVPIGWYLMKKWLEDYVYKTDLSPEVFLLAGLTAVVIALLTISYQSIRAALMKPVRNLKGD